MAIFSKSEMIRINKASGYYNFDTVTMRLFRARIADRLYPTPEGVVFVESTQFADSRGNRAQRRYTVKYMDETTGVVEKLSGFEEYSSRNGVHNRARMEQEKLRSKQG